MKIIAVTGTPASGKSRLAKPLARALNYEYLELTPFLIKNNLYDRYDKKMQTYDIDVAKMKVFLEKYLKQQTPQRGIVLDGHLTQEISPRLLDLVIVVRCHPKVLHRRLLLRKYPTQKIKENMDAELFGICEIEAREAGHKVLIIDGTSFLRGKLNNMITAVKRKIVKGRGHTRAS